LAGRGSTDGQEAGRGRRAGEEQVDALHVRMPLKVFPDEIADLLSVCDGLSGTGDCLVVRALSRHDREQVIDGEPCISDIDEDGSRQIYRYADGHGEIGASTDGRGQRPRCHDGCLSARSWYLIAKPFQRAFRAQSPADCGPKIRLVGAPTGSRLSVNESASRWK
jgi:hypothetical protein